MEKPPEKMEVRSGPQNLNSFSYSVLFFPKSATAVRPSVRLPVCRITSRASYTRHHKIVKSSMLVDILTRDVC